MKEIKGSSVYLSNLIDYHKECFEALKPIRTHATKNPSCFYGFGKSIFSLININSFDC